MPRESPGDYMRSYHDIPVVARGPTGLIMAETVHVTKYAVTASAERGRLLTALKKVLGLELPPSLATAYEWFYFPPGDPIGTTEQFYWQTIRRVFGFKGTPCEMRDVLLLACRLGRIGTGKDVAGQQPAALTMSAYASQFFSIDCNGFVGNYWGLSPEVHMSSWANISAYDEKSIHKHVAEDAGWHGWVRAGVLTLDYIPLKPRKAASDARTGDVLIDQKVGGTSWVHIATVDEVNWEGGDKVKWRVVEWGESTDVDDFDTKKDKHIKPLKTVALTQGANKALGVGHYNSTKPETSTRFRYLFAGPDSTFDPATWGRCGEEEI